MPIHVGCKMGWKLVEDSTRRGITNSCLTDKSHICPEINTYIDLTALYWFPLCRSVSSPVARLGSVSCMG